MSWITDDAELMVYVRERIRMYQFHLAPFNGNGSLGWLRNCYFSIIQQAARQDLGYWALLVAARPDKNYRQISFPYYIKATLPGDYIWFQHVDLNIPRFLSNGRGGNRIQTSFTLTQEDEPNCTMVLPGFHKNIGSWYERVRERGHDKHPPHIHKSGGKLKTTEHAGNCTRTDKIYLPVDVQDFGALVPAVCGPGDVRCSSRPTCPRHLSHVSTDGVYAGLDLATLTTLIEGALQLTI